MNDTLKNSLNKLFEKNRVVFWYDGKKEFKKDFDEFLLDGEPLEKRILDGKNDFQIKYDILKMYPKAKFFLYAPFAEPKYEDNWLLDVLLSNDQFRTEHSAIYMSEYDIDPSCFETIKKHEVFFKNEKKASAIRNISGYKSSPQNLARAMLAVMSGLDVFRIEDFVVTLIKDDFMGEKRILGNLESCNLTNDALNEIRLAYAYSGSSIRDFIVYLYEHSFNKAFGLDNPLSTNEKILLSNLKNNLDKDSLRVVSSYAYSQLGIDYKIKDKDYIELVDFDDYKDIEKFIIKPLIEKFNSSTLSSRELQEVIDKRKGGKWYLEFKPLYDGLVSATRIEENINAFKYDMSEMGQAILDYTSKWYKIDYDYRQFSLALQSEGSIDYLSSVKKRIDDKYLNSYLRKINEVWVNNIAFNFVDNGWRNQRVVIGQKFFSDYVKPVLDAGRTAVVIISDALRYEVGVELVSEIKSENRFSAIIDSALANVPTYTKVGMAALLPHDKMEISPDSDVVLVDGKSSKSSDNREEILKSYGYDAKVLGINEVVNEMDTTKLRNIIRDNSIVYIYQDVIDNGGDKINLARACRDAVVELKRAVKKLGSSNVTSMVITADHGFLFQNRDLEEYDFLSDGKIQGKQITKQGRRFVLGYDIKDSDGIKVAKLSDLGYSNTDGLEVAFPNSILRLRLSGSDKYFVHGGLSMQEVIIPVITVKKGRSEDTSYVNIESLLKVKEIVTGTVSVKYYQTDYITEKIKGFEALFGIYSEDGVLISNEVRKTINSDHVDSRDRIFNVDYVLTPDSERYRGKNVYITAKRFVDNGRTVVLESFPVLLKRNNLFGVDF